jgi:hypothetical protein
LAALLTIERRAWWPFMFDNPSQQPIETNEPFRAMASRAEGMREYRTDADLCGYDFVLLIRPGSIEPAGTLRVVGNTTASLFRVEPKPSCRGHSKQ